MMPIVGIPAPAGIPAHPEFKAMSSSVSVRAAIRENCNIDPAEAEKVQARVREQFERCNTQGQAAVGFAFDEKQGRYIVEPYED
jgi:hypothetical protein